MTATRHRKTGQKPRITISLSAALTRRLQTERWKRKTASMSALVERLLWEALERKHPEHQLGPGGFD